MNAAILDIDSSGEIKEDITEEQRRDILAYLAKKPYAEVAPLIAMLAALKRKKAGDTNGNVTSKK